MKKGKHEKLEEIVTDVVEDGHGILSCVVTNERGLIVTGQTTDGSSNDTLAAMVSLLSDSATRVSENLGYGHPKTASVKNYGINIALHEFKVRDRWFRIGAVHEAKGLLDRGFFDKLFSRGSVEDNLTNAAAKIRSVLET